MICRAIAALALGASAATAGADFDAEIRAIAERREVRAAFGDLVQQRPAFEDWLIEINEIPAPPFEEQARAEHYADLLRGVGLREVSIDEEGNVLARLPGSVGDSTIAIVAHLDTVFPAGTDVTVRRVDEKLCAPGIADNARGLVVMLALAKSMLDFRMKTKADVLFVGSVGEEGLGDLRGVRHLFREGGPGIDFFIAIDGGSESRVLNQAVGSIRYRLHFVGPGGHSWGAFGSANPAHGLARAIHRFDEKAGRYVEEPGEKTTYNVGRIGGGTSVNSIPFDNWAEIDMRSRDPERLDRIDEILKTSVEQALVEQNEKLTRGEPLTTRLDRIGYRPAGTVDLNEPLVQRALAATRYLGIEPALISGSTDANIPISMGIPAITIGRGGVSERSHSLNECWMDVDSHLAIQKALLITLATAGVGQ